MAKSERGRLLKLLFLSVVITLVVAEAVLRYVGFKPGFYNYSRWFKQVDTLKVFHGFYADSDGIFKVSPDAGKEIARRADAGVKTFFGEINTTLEVAEVYSLANFAIELKSGKLSNLFSKKYFSLLSANAGSLTDLDSAILTFVKEPINSDGFRSIPFKRYRSGKKKVLLIGDSFAWGHSATNITSSFADILLAKGYVVYNTGISGADPTQYLAIANKYIPLVQPDVVIVNFFMANDIFYFRRPLVPNFPIFFSTNAGNLIACPNGINFPGAVEAYNFVNDESTIPTQGHFINKILAQSVITTLGWRVLVKLNIAKGQPDSHGQYWREAEKLKSTKPYSNIQIDSIRTIAEGNNCKFYLVVIPDILSKKNSNPALVSGLFENMPYNISPVPKGDYCTDGHFNDEGHRKYAEFLEKLIEGSK